MGRIVIRETNIMKALWLENLNIQERYSLRDENLHHLVNVVRIEQGEKLLLLNGKGLIIEAEVESVSKKELILKHVFSEKSPRAFEFDLAIGMPKREALELCLKQATELGFRKIFLVKSEYSQMKFPETERIQNLLVSALEQSNNAFLPQVFSVEWNEIPWDEYQEALLLDSQTKISKSSTNSSLSPKLLIVGPEGGFSMREINFLHGLDQVKVVHLPTPILRTPTAVAAGAGILIHGLLK